MELCFRLKSAEMTAMLHPLERHPVLARNTELGSRATLNQDNGYFLVHGKDSLFGSLQRGKHLGTVFFCTAGSNMQPWSDATLTDDDLRFWSAKVRSGFPGEARLRDIHEYKLIDLWHRSMTLAGDKAVEFASPEQQSLAKNLDIALPDQWKQRLVSKRLWDTLQPPPEQPVEPAKPAPKPRKPRKKRGIVDLDF